MNVGNGLDRSACKDTDVNEIKNGTVKTVPYEYITGESINMELPNRKKLRLEHFDYASENFYFVTICTDNKIKLFGEPGNLNNLGKIAESDLLNISEHYKGVEIDKYVIMPNHIHAIIVVGCNPDAGINEFPSLETVIGLYKSGVSRKIHVYDPKLKVWQKSYYEHIIRNNHDYGEIWKYIDYNPIKWEEDELYI